MSIAISQPPSPKATDAPREQGGLGVSISQVRLEELLRQEIATRVATLDPVIREEIARSCELLDDDGGIAMLPIKGKDPKRTFRRLMNEHGVAYVSIRAFKWWKRSDLQALIDEHSVAAPSKCRLQKWLAGETRLRQGYGAVRPALQAKEAA